MSDPLVTCICLTHNRREWLPRAIECYQKSTYSPRELLIVGDEDDVISDLIPADESIACVCATGHPLVGDKRNLACRLADGEIIVNWDDDDWSAPGRISDQVEHLMASGNSVTGYSSLIFHETRPLQVVDDSKLRPTTGWWKWTDQNGLAAGTSLCYLRDWWLNHPFVSHQLAQDDLFYSEALQLGVADTTPGRLLMLANNHSGNVSGRMIGGVEWEELPGDPRCR